MQFVPSMAKLEETDKSRQILDMTKTLLKFRQGYAKVRLYIGNVITILGPSKCLFDHLATETRGGGNKCKISSQGNFRRPEN